MRLTLATTIIALAVLTAAAPQPVGQKTGVAIPITKCSGFENTDGSIDMEALSYHVTSIEAKILGGLDNFEKNTGASHPASLKGIQKRATGTVPLTAFNTKLWYGSISVGTPPQIFTVNFDTGSSDLVLPGPDCADSCNLHAKFKPIDSSTAHYLKYSYNLTYKDGDTVSAKAYSDTVTIAGLEAVKQTFGVATKYSTGFAKGRFPPDGIMGLGGPSPPRDESPVLHTLVSQGQIDEPAFSFKLTNTESELYIGGANENLYDGEFTYTPVTQEYHWQVKMDNIQGNGETIGSDISCRIDTGAEVVVGPAAQVAALYRKLGGTKFQSKEKTTDFYTFPCDAFPDVSFTFGGTSFPISTDTLKFKRLRSDQTRCVGGIVGMDVPFWIVGDVFLRNVYTKFDIGNKRIGFAKLRVAPAAPPTSQLPLLAGAAGASPESWLRPQSDVHHSVLMTIDLVGFVINWMSTLRYW